MRSWLAKVAATTAVAAALVSCSDKQDSDTVSAVPDQAIRSGSSETTEDGSSEAGCADANLQSNLGADTYWADFQAYVNAQGMQSSSDESTLSSDLRVIVDATPQGGQAQFGRELCPVVAGVYQTPEQLQLRSSLLYSGYSVCLNDADTDIPAIPQSSGEPMDTTVRAAREYLCPK
ncbi:hypothetical protein [Rhodococcoides fascians]|uniref:DUF732 domain-containing protein n=1 Tax=Rhodococcoides fascians TaxID=1828 RepID=A0A143QT94_RHOFA|nr:hypothetical protein [Rhodococcus fascians]AMY26230.1 hypothetical protein A3Q41_04975 [Rhodococcus fascians]OZC38147.1 hypothetical protein CHX23_23790 [Rhodococcus fascians]